MSMEQTGGKAGKFIVSALIGGVVGFAAMRFGLESGLGPMLKAAGGGAFALAAVGLVYGLMGLFVGIGVAFPGMGAKVLNVADREDLEEQRSILLGSAASCLALGIGMILLALAAPQGAVPMGVGLSAMAFALALLVAISISQWHLYDELWRSICVDSAAWSFGILALVLLVWGGLAHTGYVALPDGATLVALAMGGMLLGSFIAIGRRGMLVQS